MSEFTPGPWAYRPTNNGHFIAGTGDNSGYLAEVRHCRTKQDVKADARLIASAPDLLATLVDVSDYLSDLCDVVDGDYGNPAPNKEMTLLREVDAAIARATGETP